MEKYKIKINNEEKSLMMQALLEMRNEQIKKERPADPVNELIIKLSKK